MEDPPRPLLEGLRRPLGEAGAGGVRAQGAEGVLLCLGWKLREGVATSPPEKVPQRRDLRCQLEGQGGSSPGPYHRPLELKEAPMEGKFVPGAAAQLSLP